MKLYEITESMSSIQNIDDVDEQAIKDTLESFDMDFKEKGQNIIALTENWQADIDSLDSAIKRLSERKKAMENKRDSLKEYLRYNMEQTGINKIQCPMFTATLRAPSEIVVIDNVDMIPDDYVNVKMSVSPDKAAIKNAIKEGVDIKGARLDKGKSSLIIK